jgi:omega-amidase
MKKIADSLLVTLIQSNLHWENRDANLNMFEEKINSIEGRTELVILPEMFNTGFSMNVNQLAEAMDGYTVAWMKRISATKKIIITGSLIIEENGKYFNRLVWMLPTGDHGHYDKRHLFAYAGEDEQFDHGNKRLIASVKGWKINLQVCYDLRFPVWARQSVPVQLQADGTFQKQESSESSHPEYDVLVYVANWPEKRKHAWKTLLQARAIENQCYVIGVNRVGDDGNDHHYVGDSMVVDPAGEILHAAGDEESSFTYSLTLERLNSIRERLPFLKDADPFIIGS